MKIAIKDIKLSPYQVRDLEADPGLAALSESIKEHGQLQPIKLRPSDGGYECIFGHRRLKATELAGFYEVEAIVADVADQEAQIQALIENTQRKDLGAMELARALKVLKDATGWSNMEIARHGILPKATVAQSMALLEEPHDVQAMIKLDTAHRGAVGDQPSITREHVSKVRGPVPEPEPRADILRKAAKEGLTVDETRRVAERYAAADGPKAKAKILQTPARLEDRLEAAEERAKVRRPAEAMTVFDYISKLESATELIAKLLLAGRQVEVWEARGWPVVKAMLETIVRKIEEFLAEIEKEK